MLKIFADFFVNLTSSIWLQADTAFHYCIKNKDDVVMNLLLGAGVSVNITDGKLQTPLHIAAATGMCSSSRPVHTERLRKRT